MVHSIFDGENNSEITIDDGYFENFITITIYDKVINLNTTHYLNKKDFKGTKFIDPQNPNS